MINQYCLLAIGILSVIVLKSVYQIVMFFRMRKRDPMGCASTFGDGCTRGIRRRAVRPQMSSWSL